jgi:hypothetical protein
MLELLDHVMGSIAGLESRTLQDLQVADYDLHPDDHDGLGKEWQGKA